MIVAANFGPSEALKNAAVVFQGKGTLIDHLNPIEPPATKTGSVKLGRIPRSNDDQTVVTFRATRAWKGPVKSEIKVFAIARPSMCDGFEFEDGKEYVVYARTTLNLESKEWRTLTPKVNRVYSN